RAGGRQGQGRHDRGAHQLPQVPHSGGGGSDPHDCGAGDDLPLRRHREPAGTAHRGRLRLRRSGAAHLRADPQGPRSHVRGGPRTDRATRPEASVIDCELPTDGRTPRTLDVDTLPTLEVLRLINTEDATVPMVVASVLNEVARLVDISVESLRAGGR